MAMGLSIDGACYGFHRCINGVLFQEEEMVIEREEIFEVPANFKKVNTMQEPPMTDIGKDVSVRIPLPGIVFEVLKMW